MSLAAEDLLKLLWWSRACSAV